MNKLKIEMIPLAEITPYDHNPRDNDGAVDAVMESIKEYGFNVPLVLDKDKVIICGHTRYKASEKLGIKEVPCIIRSDLTPGQVKAYRLADNKTGDLSIWDNKLLLEELEDIREGGDDWFTGFDLGTTFDDVLGQNEVTDQDFGALYEVVFRSESMDKIERIKEIWDSMEDKDAE